MPEPPRRDSLRFWIDRDKPSGMNPVRSPTYPVRDFISNGVKERNVSPDVTSGVTSNGMNRAPPRALVGRILKTPPARPLRYFSGERDQKPLFQIFWSGSPEK